MSGIGVAVGIGYQSVLGVLPIRPEVDAYITRVEADGGTVFLTANIISSRLNGITCPDFPQVIIDYILRVRADGGETQRPSIQIADEYFSLVCRFFPQIVVDYFERVADDNGTTFFSHLTTRDRLAQFTCI